MTKKLTPNQFRRLFPYASKSTLICNNATESNGMPSESEQVDRERLGEAFGSEEVGTQYRLCRVEINFIARHGKTLDEDNRRYIAKPILDALVNLGFASDDKDITSETTQWDNKNKLNF